MKYDNVLRLKSVKKSCSHCMYAGCIPFSSHTLCTLSNTTVSSKKEQKMCKHYKYYKSKEK